MNLFFLYFPFGIVLGIWLYRKYEEHQKRKAENKRKKVCESNNELINLHDRKSKKDSKLNFYTDIKCEVCNKSIKGKWDSQVYLGMETGELDKIGINRWLIYDKHIKCSPSRAQRIVHPKYPTVVDERPQFDWRPEADNTWTDQMRNKYRELYTDAWVRLQERYNPDWDTKST